MIPKHLNLVTGILVFLLIPFFTWAQLTLKVNSIPANTPLRDNIFVVGSFNNWNPGDSSYMLKKQPEGHYSLVLQLPSGEIKFKFTRGSWPKVEGNAAGQFLADRTLSYSGNPQIADFNILTWEDLSGNNQGDGNPAANVKILSNDFYMPQLGRNRRIWIQLPLDYDFSQKNYPVLYMHDGQNLFDNSTSFSGEWEVDESINKLFQSGDYGAIVVGIDNGGANRLAEYTPWPNPTFGGGEGIKYARFIVETLKPYIDKNYRTKADRENTGIMGSSLGGLISMYMAIEYQEIFGKAGIFSPSFWFSPNAYTHVSSMGKRKDMKIYLLAGQLEDEGSVVRDLQAMYNTLRTAGFTENEIKTAVHNDGQHTEWYWAREFPAAYKWLFGNLSTPVSRPTQNPYQVKLYPNPTQNTLQIQSNFEIKNKRVQIYSINGSELVPPTFLEGGSFNASFLKPGVYVFNIFSGNQLVSSEKLVIN